MSRSVGVGGDPMWATYDPADREVYVENFDTNNVSVLKGTAVVGTVAVGGGPVSAAFDGNNGTMYILNAITNNVSILRGTTVVGTVDVGVAPEYAAFDPRNGFVYVPNSGGGTVTVLNGTNSMGTIVVGSSPWNATYDPTSGYIYVENEGSDTVSVISGTSVVATVGVGQGPSSSTYDPFNGWEYVPNWRSGNVSVLNGTKLLGSISVGATPYFGGYDPANHDVYIANYGSANVTVLSGMTKVGTVSVQGGPYAVTYNPSDGYVYIADSGAFTMSVLNGTTTVATLGGGVYALTAAFDGADGLVYVPNYGSDNVTIYGDEYRVIFDEQGLPNGTTWSVSLSTGASNTSTLSSLGFDLLNGVYTYRVTSSNTTYDAPGGTFRVSAGPLTISLVFSRVTFLVVFEETGLPAGTSWSVTFAAQTQNTTGTNSTSLTFLATNGTFAYRWGIVPGWTTAAFRGSVSVNGSAQLVSTNWTLSKYIVTFNETGLPTGSAWWINVTNGPHTLSTHTTLTIPEPNGSYRYSPASVDPSFSAPRGTFAVDGVPQSLGVSFQLDLYLLSFVEFGLPPGTWWTVLIGGVALASPNASMSVYEPNGSFAYTLHPVPGWIPGRYAGYVTVRGNSPPVRIDWTQITYSVTFTASGLASSATPFSVTFNGSTESWDPGGICAPPGSYCDEVVFTGFLNGSYSFTIGPVSGYSASPSRGRITVDGANVTSTIAFAATLLGLPLIEGAGLLVGITAAVVATALVILLRARRGKAVPRRVESLPDEPSGGGPPPDP